ncbi:MAG: NAD-dependent epimerase/dehydratase family protein, partial [Gammaproteobacteria bacterium]
MTERRILITGATGQIGTELTAALRERYGADAVVAAGHKTRPDEAFSASGPFCLFDVRDADALVGIVEKYDIGTVYHLASLLSAVAEDKPQLAWDINMNGLFNVLETAKNHRCSVFFPSSIGAFGPNTPRDGTPQDTLQQPTTMYGVTKVSGELLCNYYHRRFGVDTRG